MKGQMITLKANGTRVTKDFDGKFPSLKELQAGVGGYIEAVPLFTWFEGQRCVAFCNEEGKLEGLPINDAASLAWTRAAGVYMGDLLCGDVLVLVGDPEWLAKL